MAGVNNLSNQNAEGPEPKSSLYIERCANSDEKMTHAWVGDMRKFSIIVSWMDEKVL